jgi:uncharacterized Tic20 family protein
MTSQTNNPTTDESLLAAIAHFFGLLLAFIVWVTQKDKSRFVRFQSIQAMAFDLLVYGVMLLLIGLAMCLIFGVLAIGVGDIALFGSQGNPTAEPVRTVIALLAATPLLFPLIFLPLSGLIFIFRLIAAIQSWQGKNYHYPGLGKWVEAKLSE